MRLSLVASIAALALALVGCSSSSKPAANPGNAGGSSDGSAAPEVDCADYEHQVELCRPSCEECQVSTPGNSCNVCAEACADRATASCAKPE